MVCNRILTNGLIIQWGQTDGEVYTLNVNYTSSNSYFCAGARRGGTYADTSVSITRVSNNQIRSDGNSRNIYFITIGY